MSCPDCGSRSKQVKFVTVKSLVRHLPFGMPSTQYYFCETASCDIVYFPWDAKAPSFRRDDLLVRVALNESDVTLPLCYCFGISRKQIWDEIRQSGKSMAVERIRAEVKSGRCACEVKNPSGTCCLGNVVRAAQEGLKVAKRTSLVNSGEQL